MHCARSVQTKLTVTLHALRYTNGDQIITDVTASDDHMAAGMSPVTAGTGVSRLVQQRANDSCLEHKHYLSIIATFYTVVHKKRQKSINFHHYWYAYIPSIFCNHTVVIFPT